MNEDEQKHDEWARKRLSRSAFGPQFTPSGSLAKSYASRYFVREVDRRQAYLRARLTGSGGHTRLVDLV